MGAHRRSLTPTWGWRGQLRGKGHLFCEPKRNKNLVGEESRGCGFEGEREHEVIRSKRSLEWLELVKVQMGRSTKEARSWRLPGHSREESGFNSMEVPKLT